MHNKWILTIIPIYKLNIVLIEFQIIVIQGTAAMTNISKEIVDLILRIHIH